MPSPSSFRWFVLGSIVLMGAALAQDAIPSASISGVGQQRLGSDFTFTVGFDNASTTQPGFGPFIDFAFDYTGPDGSYDTLTGTYTEDPDGVTIAASGAVTYLNTPVTYQIFTFDDTANDGQGIPHPYAVDSSGDPIYVTTADFPGRPFQNGDRFGVALLPFGSFTPTQPVANLSIEASLSDEADLAVDVPISARAGFRFGNDPLANPTTDPSLIQATPVDADLEPTLWDLTKIYNGPEDETATGPNFLREYTLEVDIADGQTIDPVTITDNLPDGMQFTRIVAAEIGGSPYTDPSPALPSTTTPGGTLVYNFGSVTGASGVDASVTFEYFVPRLYSTDGVIITANTGDDVLLENQAHATGEWDPIDTRDGEDVPVYAEAPSGTPDGDPEHTLQAQSVAIQKSVAIAIDNGLGGYTPGDVLEYTLEIQVSDYFAFDDIGVDDLLADGQEFDDTFTPTLSISEHGTSSSGAFNAANYTETTNRSADGDPTPNDGTTALQFRVSDELVSRSLNPNLTGGGIDNETTGLSGTPYNNPPMPNGATTATIVYRAVISDEYSEQAPSGDEPLNPGDGSSNSVDVDGRLLDPASGLTPYTGNPREGDDSGAGFTILPGNLLKSIYAINGETDSSNWIVNPTGDINVQPDDTVTFRIEFTIPTGDAEELTFTDFLPLPVFDVADPDADGNAGPSWTFDAAGSPGPGDSTPPATGHAKFGPDESWYLIRQALPTPSIDIAAGANTLIFDYGTADDPTNTARKVDILFTVTVSRDPFADGLFLTNQVRKSQQDTNEEVSTLDDIGNFILNEPDVTIHKGVVGYRTTGLTLDGVTFTAPDQASSFSPTPVYDAADAAAIEASDLLTNEVDAGDEVRFAIMARNAGRSDAFDVTITDAVPPGFTIPASTTGMELTVRRGDGTLLTSGTDYTASIDAGGNLSVELADNYTAGNVGAETKSGSLSRGYNAGTDSPVTNGSSTVIITYDLTVDTSAEALGETTNTATLTNYSNVEGGDDFTADDPSDEAVVNFRPASFDKAFTNTEIDDSGSTGYNVNDEAVIGEFVTYTLTVTVPEGTTAGAILNDTLDNGLAFVDVQGVTLSSGVSTGNPIGTGANPSHVSITDSGRSVDYDFGDITNSDTDNGTAETIVIVYRAVVLNISGNPGNQAGTTLNNTASFDYTNNGTPLTASAAGITVIEPVVTIDKQVSTTATGPWSDSISNLDAGDTFYYRIRLANPAANSTVAYNITLSDVLPSAVKTATIHSSTGGAGYDETDFTVVLGPPDEVRLDSSENPDGITLSPGQSVDVIIEAQVNDLVEPGELVVNDEAQVDWTSLGAQDGENLTTDGTPTPRSEHNASSVERSGDDGEGGALNDYADVDDVSADVGVRNPDPVKSLVSTSEAHTSDAANPPRVAIGEIVRYRIVWQIPEGQATALNFRDDIPDINPGGGFVFLDDGTARVAFISNDPTGGITTDDATINGLSGLAIEGAAPAAPTAVLPAAAIEDEGGDGTFGKGEDVIFSLGTVTNDDRDDDAEYIVIEFNALLHNEPAPGRHDAGETNTNTAAIYTGDTELNSSNGVTVSTVEPSVNVSKSVSTGPFDAGDTVTYTVVISNAGGGDNTTAFDLDFSDELPDAYLESFAVTTPLTTTGTVVGESAGFTDNTLTITATSMDAGSTLTVEYTAVVVDGFLAGEEAIDNTISGTYTSLPGTGTASNPTGSTTPGGTGDTDGERDGSDGAGGNPNDYFASDNADFDGVVPQLDKTFKDGTITEDDTNVITSSGADVVIGEQVVYDILVTLPEGLTEDLRVTDIVPAGLRVESFELLDNATEAGQTDLLGAAFNGTIANNPPTVTPALPATDGADIEFDFGDVTTTDDNDTGNNSFVIRVTATVLNVAGNQGETPTQLTNRATLNYTDPETGDTPISDSNPGNDPTVTVVEPELTLDKSVDPTSGDAGDTVTYTFVITNTSTQAAYDVDLADELPSELNSPSILSGGDFVVAGFPDSTVDAATTGNLAGTFSAGQLSGVALNASDELVIDGVTLAVTNLVLLKDQTNAQENGIYEVTAIDAGNDEATLNRIAGFDEASEILPAYRVGVDAGTANAGKVFWQTETVVTVNTDYILWEEVDVPTSADFSVAGDELATTAPFDLPAGASVTLKVQGTLDVLVEAEETITNTADVTWTSTDGSNDDERDGSGGIDNYATSDDADLDIDVAGFTKDFTLTSIVDGVNENDEAVIGELVTYTLTVTVPEGTTKTATIVDTLDDGLAFVEVVSVTPSTGVTMQTPIGTGTTPDNVTVGDAGAGQGNELTFSFGDITNANTDNGTNNTIVIVYRAVVLNVIGNQSSTTLNNSAVFDYTNNDAPITDSAADITVIEPAVTIAKTISDSPTTGFDNSLSGLDAGDTVYYLLRLVSNGDTTAYNVTLSDTLPAVFASAGIHSVSGGGFATADFEVTGGLVVQVDPTENENGLTIPSGTTVDIVVEATLLASIEAGLEFSNTNARVDYTSLDDGNTTPEDPPQLSTHNSNSTERSGDDGEGGGLNNYSDLNNVAADGQIDTPTVDKAFQDGSISADDTSVDSSTGSTVVIGETVTYDILVTLPEGVTSDLAVRDSLRAGLRIDSYSVITSAASSGMLTSDFDGTVTTSPSIAPSLPVSGTSTVVFSFGNTTVTDDNDAGDNAFVLRVTAMVENVAGNQDSPTTNLTNTADLQFTDPESGTETVTDANGGPMVTVDEPTLTIAKSVDPTTGDAGDEVTYTIEIENTSGQVAYDIELSDDLPDKLDSPQILSGADFEATGFSTTFPAPAVGDFGINSGVLENASDIDMPPGSTIVLKVRGTLDTTVGAAETIPNQADITWSSTDGDNDDERDGADGPGGPLDDYAATDNADIQTDPMAAAKSLFETSESSTAGADVTIGETATYALKVTLPEGEIDSLVIEDAVPAGMTYVSHSLVTTHVASESPIDGFLLDADFAGTFADGSEPDVTGGTGDGVDVTFTFDAGPPAITVTNDNNAGNNSFLILIVLRTVDVAGNVGVNPPGQTTLTNRATFTVSGQNPVTPPGVDVDVVEPRMVITKEMTPAQADAGATISVTLTVENTGTSDAFEVIVEDPLDDTAFDIGSIQLGTQGTEYPADFTAALDGNTIRYTGGTITDGETVTFNYTVDLLDAVDPADVITNTATVTQATTLPGDDPNERDEPDVDDTDEVTLNSHAINGTVYHDVDNDGVYTAGTDTHLQGVDVTLTGTDHLGNAIDITVQTDVNGFYEFTELRPGDYVLTETQPAGYLDNDETVGTNFDGTADNTADSNVITAITIPLGLTEDTTGEGYDFGEVLPNSLAGTVFADVNNDGLINGADFGLENVDVTLTGTDDRGNPVNTTLQTDGDGAYLFDNLRPGTYTITETQPPLYGDGIDTVGTAGGDGTVSDVFSNIDLSNSQNVDGTDYDFGETTASISGQVRRDIDGDGDLTDDEYPRVGIPIEIYTDPNGDGDKSDGQLIATMNTDANGEYRFEGLAAGNYVVIENDPGTDHTSTNDADGGTDENSWNTIPVTLPAGTHVPNRDFLDEPDDPPTLAVIGAIQANVLDDSVVVSWETASEVGAVHFRLLRETAGDGSPLAAVTANPIPAIGERRGGTYHVRDKAAATAVGTVLSYVVEELETSGRARHYGPFEVVVGDAGVPDGVAGRLLDADAASTARPLPADVANGMAVRGPDPTRGGAGPEPKEIPVESGLPPTASQVAASRLNPFARLARLSVDEDGMQYVSAAAVAEAVGLDEELVRAAIRTGMLSVSNGQTPVACLPEVDGSGVYFYADHRDDAYSNATVYTVSFGVGREIKVQDSMPADGATPTTFMDVARFEQDRKAIPESLDDPQNGLWVWASIAATNPAFNSWRHTFDLDGFAGEADAQCLLSVKLSGGSQSTADIDHRVELRINGALLETTEWDGLGPYTADLQFAAGLLAENGNELTITALLPDNVAGSLVHVDSFAVVYPRRHVAAHDRLEFTADGLETVVVDGFSNPDISLFDITDPAAPVAVANGTVTESADGNYAIAFKPAAATARYLALAAPSETGTVSAGVVPVLRNRRNAADYLVIAPLALHDAARPLVEHRRNLGHQVMLVALEDVYQAFSGGQTTPAALRDFVRYAWAEWDTPPKYVLLAGNGTNDYRNVLRRNDNLVPPTLVPTEHGLVVSDAMLGDVDGSDVIPELAVGRLPARNADELANMIAKIIRYETSTTRSQRSDLLLVADAPDDGGDFPADCDRIAAAMPAPCDIRRIGLGEQDLAQSREALHGELALGARIVAYLGHGAYDRLSRAGVLRTGDVATLSTGELPPVLVAGTCVAGEFSLPGANSLAESLVAASQGCVAVWAPSGPAYNDLSRDLMEAFCRQVFTEGEEVLGDAVLSALKSQQNVALNSERVRQGCRMFNLLGDPATRIRTDDR